MEHIEEAGVHSGDSACSRPAHSLPKKVQDEIRTQIVKLAKALKVVGLMNTQFAVQDGKVYLLEVNPRASRTSPFVSKATGRPLATIAARCMAGQSLKRSEERRVGKECVSTCRSRWSAYHEKRIRINNENPITIRDNKSR